MKNRLLGIFRNKNFLLSLLFVLIAFISIFLLIWISQDFSFDEFFTYIKTASPKWIISSVLSMLMFIVFEGMALTVICRVFGYKTRLHQGYIFCSRYIFFCHNTISNGRSACKCIFYDQGRHFRRYGNGSFAA